MEGYDYYVLGLGNPLHPGNQEYEDTTVEVEALLILGDYVEGAVPLNKDETEEYNVDEGFKLEVVKTMEDDDDIVHNLDTYFRKKYGFWPIDIIIKNKS